LPIKPICLITNIHQPPEPMTFYNKVKWILSILSIFLVILATNLIDRKNFRIVTNSVETIYADRLVAQDIILDLYGLVWEKELVYVKYDNSSFKTKNTSLNTHFKELIEVFSTTKLTEREAIVFGQLQKNFENQEAYERTLSESQVPNPEFEENLALLKDNLDDLSGIQLEQGRRELIESKRAIKSVDLLTHLEIYALIIIAIALQLVILYNPKTKSNR
jgi:hypothetical protein